MIPKRVHYCWFGKGEFPELTIKCIESWKKYLPEYEFIEWNEDNFDINCNQFVKEAYESKKYAFVTDYVRLYALYNYGGIYMDTDVEVLKSLDIFLHNRAFMGCENEQMCGTGTMAAEKNHRWIKELLDYYENKKFILSEKKYNTIPNTYLITQHTINKYGWQSNNEHQILNEGLNIYPFEFFCAKDFRTGKLKVTSDTYTIHHFSGSWLTKKDKFKNRIINILGPRYSELVVNLKRKLIRK